MAVSLLLLAAVIVAVYGRPDLNDGQQEQELAETINTKSHCRMTFDTRLTFVYPNEEGEPPYPLCSSRCWGKEEAVHGRPDLNDGPDDQERLETITTNSHCRMTIERVYQDEEGQAPYPLCSSRCSGKEEGVLGKPELNDGPQDQEVLKTISTKSHCRMTFEIVYPEEEGEQPYPLCSSRCSGKEELWIDGVVFRRMSELIEYNLMVEMTYKNGSLQGCKMVPYEAAPDAVYSPVASPPAIDFRPLPREENVESTLIRYKSRDPEDVKHWTDSLDEFIKPYEGQSGQRVMQCSEENRPGEQEVCTFRVTWLEGNCHKWAKWGYPLDSPCILLTLNKMINWEPEVYDNLDELPEDMPQDLKDHIAYLTEANQGNVPKMIWVSCKGENPADEEYVGTVKYSPWRGFPAYYFPYRNTPGYLSPIVAVEFTQSQPFVLINVECKAWAKNIKHERGNRLGLVHFEILKE